MFHDQSLNNLYRITQTRYMRYWTILIIPLGSVYGLSPYLHERRPPQMKRRRPGRRPFIAEVDSPACIRRPDLIFWDPELNKSKVVLSHVIRVPRLNLACVKF